MTSMYKVHSRHTLFSGLLCLSARLVPIQSREASTVILLGHGGKSPQAGNPSWGLCPVLNMNLSKCMDLPEPAGQTPHSVKVSTSAETTH